jgi:hypothetical protein
MIDDRFKETGPAIRAGPIGERCVLYPGNRIKPCGLSLYLEIFTGKIYLKMLEPSWAAIVIMRSTFYVASSGEFFNPTTFRGEMKGISK